MSNLGLAITSLFSGVGALDYGLELSGLGYITSQVEIDSYCQNVLERHFPAARRFKDIKHVGGNEVKAEVFCGGFPCQGISRAGSGRGLDDDRSGLWREYARLVEEARPEWVIIENSAQLVKRGLVTVLGDLAALGYAAWWDCLPASVVGAPHQRDRLFVVARRPPRPQLADARGDVLASKGCSVGFEAVARRKPGTEGQEPPNRGRTRLRPSRRTRQPELARQPDGPPSGMDEVAVARASFSAAPSAAVNALFHFPAPPFAPPLSHEPPRTAPPPLSRVRHRAIGNAVVPALGYILGMSIKRIIESEQRADA